MLAPLLLCAVVFAQNAAPNNAPNKAHDIKAHDIKAHDIVVRSLRADNEALAIASQYTYQEHDLTKELDGAGNLRKTTSETRDILFLGGKRYERLTARNDAPLPAAEARKEKARLDKAAAEAARLTPSERDRRFADYQRERAKQRESVKMIPDAYDFSLLRDSLHDGRPCYLIQADPRSAYRGKYANLLRNIRGKIWIDKSDLEWVRLEAEVLDDVSFGFFLARMSRGSHFTLERTRVNNEVWLPKSITARVTARALVKHFNLEEIVIYSNYQRFSTDSHIISEP